MLGALKELLDKGVVVFDGAMGTLLYARGVYINQNFDALNLFRPDLVEKVHRDYLLAGAMVLTTNTFGANRIKLGRYGLEDKVKEINKAGVALARRASGGKALVAGSIGPTGVVPDIFDKSQLALLRDVFREQIEALLEAQVDILIFETFRHTLEINLAIEEARKVFDGCIIGQMALDDSLQTADGKSPERVAQLLRDFGADIVGLNCGIGPAQMAEAISGMLCAGVPVIAQPNAGYPRRLEGRVMYMATPEYLGEHTKQYLRAGAKIVGGCCGTTPEHIRQVANEARLFVGGKIEIPKETVAIEVSDAEMRVPLPVEERSEFGRVLKDGWVISVEIDPPPGTDATKVLEAVKDLASAGIKFINVADGPRAMARMSALSLAKLIQDSAGIETILHVTCRDRNLLGIQADLLGAWALGIKNLLVITGDPTKLGDYPMATSVYDLDSIGLLRLVSMLNRGLEPSSRRMKGATGFVKGCGVEPGAKDLDREVERLFKKVEAGAEFVMTQPVFDAEVFLNFLEKVKGINIPIIMGVLPLVSYRNAEFLDNEVPGMHIPKDIKERMRKADKGEPARREGVAIARELVSQMKDKVNGIYIMPLLGHFEMVKEIVEGMV